MDKEFEKQYHQLEKSHWWFLSRREYVRKLMRSTDRSKKVLDIGCSSGLLLSELEQEGFPKENLFGIDISPEAIELCHEYGYENTYVMDATHAAFENQKFDVIVASDCLEHLEDDNTASVNWKKLLNPGGKLIVFVPAFMSLWSPHDVVNHHFRRYKLKQLKKVFLEEGLTVEKRGYWNSTLFLPALFVRTINRMFKMDKEPDSSGDLKMNNGLLNKLLLTLLRFENAMLCVFRYPFGISTYVVLEKKA